MAGAIGRARVAVSTLAAAVLGLLPHVLHHAGPLAGAALLGGITGSLVFGALGLVLSLPLLVRLRRRSGSWRLPAALLLVFVTAFSVSTFLIGPAITGAKDDAAPSQSQPAPSPDRAGGRDAHH